MQLQEAFCKNNLFKHSLFNIALSVIQPSIPPPRLLEVYVDWQMHPIYVGYRQQS